MFSRYPTRILKFLVHAIENWVVGLLGNIFNKRRQESVELWFEPTADNQEDSGTAKTRAASAEVNSRKLPSLKNANEPSRFDRCDTLFQDQLLPAAATSKQARPSRIDELYETLNCVEPVVTESQGSINPAEISSDCSSRKEKSQVSIVPRVSFEFNPDKENRATIHESTRNQKKSRRSNSSLTLNADDARNTGNNFHAHSINSDNSVEQQEKQVINSESVNVSSVTPSSKTSSPTFFVNPNMPNDSSVKESESAPKTTVPSGSETSKAPDSANSGLSREGQRTVLQNSKRADVYLNQHGQTSINFAAPFSKTSDIQTQHADKQPPATAELLWPELPYESLRNNVDSTKARHHWPQLPAETNAIELRLLSSEAIQRVGILIQELEHIRKLVDEQKGKIWNA